MGIILGADIVPTKSNQDLFINADASVLVGEALKETLDRAEFRVFNLETPLVSTLSPIKKCGPNLSAPQGAVAGLKELGIDLFTLANNHILDQGVEGLHNTQRCLQDNGISFLGVGDDPEAAGKPYIYKTKQGRKIGFYACVEHEFSVVSQSTPGANPYDPLESFDHVQALKAQCDYVVVLYHGGKEYYRYPSPKLQKTCRKFIEKGADLVVCQHSHCIGCQEDYQGGRVVYGQGNFLFDMGDDEYKRTGLLISLDEDFHITYIPVVKAGSCVRKAEKEKAQQILDDFYARSEEITQPEFVERVYAAFAQKMLYRYFQSYAAIRKNPIHAVLNKLTAHRYGKWLLTRMYDEKKSYELQNMLECEAHWELFLEGVKGIRK